MRRNELETKVLRLLRTCSFPTHIEDSTWELKSESSADPTRAARQLAGHANASRGEVIVWVFGVDEKRGVVGIEPFEVGVFLSQIEKSFASKMPELVSAVITEYDGKHIQILAFYTDEAPYLINNPMAGEKGERADREVPWRVGDVTRSATREQLLRMLESAVSQPEVDLLGTRLRLVTNFEEGRYQAVRYHVESKFYLIPRQDKPLIFPLYKMQMRMLDQNGTSRMLHDFDLHVSKENGDRSSSLLITDDELIVSGPGLVRLTAVTKIMNRLRLFQGPVTVEFAMTPVLASWQLRVTAVCEDVDNEMVVSGESDTDTPVLWLAQSPYGAGAVHFEDPPRDWQDEAMREMAAELKKFIERKQAEDLREE